VIVFKHESKGVNVVLGFCVFSKGDAHPNRHFSISCVGERGEREQERTLNRHIDQVANKE